MHHARNPAQRRYNRRVVALGIGYALILFAVVWFFRDHHPTGPLAYVLGVLPALPLIGIFVTTGYYFVDEEDEYVRMLEIRKSLIATGFMLSVTTAWGFLQSFDVLPRVDFYWAAILWFFGQGVGSCWNRIRA